MTDARVRLEGIDRRFGTVVALDGAGLTLFDGEVHGVLGANGAGKSTLLNIVGGMLRPDAGRIAIGGRTVEFGSPRDAWAEGIGLVHQHFTLVPALTVLENLALGRRGPDADGDALRRVVEALMERTGLRVPLEPPVETLGVGDRQRIEVLKALLRDPRVLVLDEPTAVLTPDEIEGLFALLRDLAAEGRAIVLVAHKIDEVLGVADRATVLRAGRTVLETTPAEWSAEKIVRAMVGDDAVDPVALGWSGSGEDHGERAADRSRAGTGLVTSAAGPTGSDRAVARLRAVTVVDAGTRRLDAVGLEVRAGRVLGIAGVEGNGQRELARVLAGRLRPSEGTAELPVEVGFIPQDRTREGLIDDFDLVENVALALHRRPEHGEGAWLRWGWMAEAAERIRTRYEVAAPSVRTPAGSLSGGNQQRVIVGRELAMASEMLVAENPTRGLDVAAAAFVHAELRRLADEGIAIVLISTDLDEVLSLSDEVVAIARGTLVPIPPEERTREGVGARMLGGGRSLGGEPNG